MGGVVLASTKQSVGVVHLNADTCFRDCFTCNFAALAAVQEPSLAMTETVVSSQRH